MLFVEWFNWCENLTAARLDVGLVRLVMLVNLIGMKVSKVIKYMKIV